MVTASQVKVAVRENTAGSDVMSGQGCSAALQEHAFSLFFFSSLRKKVLIFTGTL